MKRILAVLGIGFGLSFSYSVAAPCEIIPVRLTCEMMMSPNCIDVPDPALSWVNAPVDAQVKGAEQSAYRIRVASSRDKLGKADLWDSRKVKSDDSVFIPYQGKPFLSGSQVWWQVKVWDGNGKPSDWSEPASGEPA